MNETIKELSKHVKRPYNRELFEELVKRYNHCCDGKKFIFSLFDNIYKMINYDNSDPNLFDKNSYKNFINNLFYSSIYNDKDTSRSISRQNGWIYADSKYLGMKCIDTTNIKHRFYIEPHSKDLYKCADEIMKQLKKDNVPFFFKTINYRPNKKYRKDAIVIYCDDENLLKTLKSLSRFKNNYPSLVSNCHKPSIILGNLNNWIGYAKEENEGSYTQKFADSIYMAIKDFSKRYMEENNIVVTYYDPICKRNSQYDAESFFNTRANFDDRLYKLSKKIIPKDKENFYITLGLKLLENGFDIYNLAFANEDIKKYVKKG